MHQFEPVIQQLRCLIVNGTLTGNDNLNDTAFNQDTANTAAGINGAGPTPGIGLNSLYGPWLERIDVGLARSFSIGEGKQLQFQAQVFNLFNHANYYVQNGDGINQLQYNPIGTNCGDGVSLNQTCYLVPNSGPGFVPRQRKEHLSIFLIGRVSDLHLNQALNIAKPVETCADRTVL